jgi:uncharacterized protein YbaP (TraB family)
MRLFIAILGSIFFSLQLHAQKQSLLYKVSGNGLSKPSYVYGTIHMICEDEFFLMDELTTAMNQVKALYLEIDISDSLAMSAAIMKMIDPTVSDLYDEMEDNFKDEISRYLLEMGMNFETIRFFKPFMVSMMLTQSLYSCEVKSYEVELMAMATEGGIPVKALETMEQQMAIFDSIPLEQQFQDLKEMVMNMPEAAEELRAIVKFYTEMNLEGLMKMMDGHSLMQFDDFILTHRNQAWIPIMEKQMRKEPALFAVGAAHLLGDQGVITLLKERGFKVQPVL